MRGSGFQVAGVTSKKYLGRKTSLKINQLKSGIISGCSILHLFHTLAPCKRILRCSWFAISSTLPQEPLNLNFASLYAIFNKDTGRSTIDNPRCQERG